MKVTFIIGNGFDIALAEKYGIYQTSYKGLYDWNRRFGFSEIEQFGNQVVSSIYSADSDELWADFENGLIEYYKGLKNDEDKIKFFNDKDQFCGYAYDYLKNFYERTVNSNNFMIDCLEEFSESVINFFSRLTNDHKSKLEDWILSNYNSEKLIEIDFINFNGTNTLELLVNEMKKKSYSMDIGEESYDIQFGKIRYVHSKLDGKTENYHQYAFGTTEVSFCNSGSSIQNLLNKTNYEFEEWIKDTDLFITHGLSFGTSDEYYWGKIVEKLYRKSMIIDFPFVLDTSKACDKQLLKIEKKRISSLAKYDEENIKNKVIISILPSFKLNESSAGIFSF